jgi:hypothetical protein
MKLLLGLLLVGLIGAVHAGNLCYWCYWDSKGGKDHNMGLPYDEKCKDDPPLARVVWCEDECVSGVKEGKFIGFC